MQKWLYLMAGSLFGLVALAFFRLWYIGTPNLDGLPMIMSWEITRRTVIFCLMAVMGISFLKLYLHPMEEGGLKRLLKWSLFLQFVAFFSLPLTSNDIFSNLAYGDMSRLGLDLHHVGVAALPPDNPFRQLVTARWMDMPMVYGPVIGLLHRLVVIPGDLWASIAFYKLAALLISSAITVVAYFFCRRHFTGERACRSFVLFALNPVFIWDMCAQAHNDALIVLGTLLFVFFLKEGRNWPAFFSLLFALMAKLAVLPVLGLFFCYTFFNSKRRFLAFCVFFIIVGVLFSGQLIEKMELVLVAPKEQGIDVSRLTGTPLYLIYKLAGPIGYKVYWALSMAVMAFLGLFFAWRSRSVDALFYSSFLFILLFNLIASPMYQPWYIAWILPFAMTLENDKMRRFYAYYCVISMAQYAVLNSTTGAIINTLVLIAFLCVFRMSGRPLSFLR